MLRLLGDAERKVIGEGVGGCKNLFQCGILAGDRIP
jgi:hypothetical protein